MLQLLCFLLAKPPHDFATEKNKVFYEDNQHFTWKKDIIFRNS